MKLIQTTTPNLAASEPADIPATDLNVALTDLDSLIEHCVERLEYQQKTDARCREYALAITKLEEAAHWLEARRRRIGGKP